MSYRPYYSKGDWLALCDSCGRVVKASELRKRWDGMMVDDRCFETRHPQDFVRGIADVQTPPFSRPEPSDVFIPFHYTYSFADSTTVSDQTTKAIGLRYVPIVELDPIDMGPLNTWPINYTTIPPVDINTIGIQESIQTGSNYGLSATVPVNEVFSFRFSTTTVLDGSTLNSYSLD
jgi:hypothetical protein